MKTDINMNTNVLNTLHEEITVDGDEYGQLEDADVSVCTKRYILRSFLKPYSTCIAKIRNGETE